MGTKWSVMINGKHKKTQKNQRATHMRQAATAGDTGVFPFLFIL